MRSKKFDFSAFLLSFASDVAVLALSYCCAYVARLNFARPSFGWASAVAAFLIVVIVYELSLRVTRAASIPWVRINILEVPRFIVAVVVASAVLLLLRYILGDTRLAAYRPPYSVTFVMAPLALAGLLLVRFLGKSYFVAKGESGSLLLRNERDVDDSAVVSFIAGKTVMVTGAGGSIGSEIVRQVVKAGAKCVVMVERGENALYEIDREMRELGAPSSVVAEMVDVSDERAMRKTFERFRPEIVLHAAAYKHVPMVENNPRQGLVNNSLATRLLGELAVEYGVMRFVMISTDKAVNPVGIMGFTKRFAEVMLLDLNGRGKTVFSAVRFGNVLGSSGSVVPLFSEQIAKGGPVTVTHPAMKRYFMTVREAVALVLQSATLKAAADSIFVLDMGEQVRIVYLAEDMIRRAGLRPYRDIRIKFTGVRAGEKLSEELNVNTDDYIKTGHSRIFACRNQTLDHERVEELLVGLRKLVDSDVPNAKLADAIRAMKV